ncbi:hypothetical protein BOX15_Mlig003655g1 [Macrostomum lignano]|uniref:AN1-type zinc finger protein 6 n=2 Tax=Macrostomum lignano TaxID=282301 RepID=A0A1I8GM57_9PLAT|nr:hypothetical protein BOX15_Mlig003655g1 [Macrostomum lignano]
MSENDNQQPLATVFCKNGCGFYGSNQFDGLCSVCFKQALSKGQPQVPAPVMHSSASSSSLRAAHSTAAAAASDAISTPDAAPSLLPAQPAGALTSNLSTSSFLSVNSSEASAAESSDSQQPQSAAGSSSTTSSSKRRNRCEICKKKVGLTGFECRCGGVYCSVHRYSDKHDCQFDYQGVGQAEIRKANPVVVKSKVDKL